MQQSKFGLPVTATGSTHIDKEFCKRVTEAYPQKIEMDRLRNVGICFISKGDPEANKNKRCPCSVEYRYGYKTCVIVS